MDGHIYASCRVGEPQKRLLLVLRNYLCWNGIGIEISVGVDPFAFFKTRHDTRMLSNIVYVGNRYFYYYLI